MNCESILIEKLEYKDFVLYVYCQFYYEKGIKFYLREKSRNKILKFKNIKNFSYYFDHDFLNLDDNTLEDEIAKIFFKNLFYRSKKNKKIYICDQNQSFVIIEFDEEKEWNYREEKI
ncbi:MAG: hypothetical protein KGV57_01910 [Fusobacterium sp.]|nr:hypothetical protein [Fusobacterium sp.]